MNLAVYCKTMNENIQRCKSYNKSKFQEQNSKILFARSSLTRWLPVYEYIVARNLTEAAVFTPLCSCV